MKLVGYLNGVPMYESDAVPDGMVFLTKPMKGMDKDQMPTIGAIVEGVRRMQEDNSKVTTLYSGKIIGKKWVSGRDTVGYIAVQRADGWTCYTGVAHGKSEQTDAQDIADHGAKTDKAVAIAMFPELPADNYVV